MKSTYYLEQYRSKGFIKLKNIFSNNDVDKILLELEKVKSMLPEIKKKNYFIKLKMARLIQFTTYKSFIKKINLKK